MPAVGRDIAHDSAVTHVTGESIFLDDVAPMPGELLAGIVPSPVAHGRVKRLDLSGCLDVPGVVAVMTHRDVARHKLLRPVVKDEHLIVERESVFLGQRWRSRSDSATLFTRALPRRQMGSCAVLIESDASSVLTDADGGCVSGFGARREGPNRASLTDQ